MKIVGMAIFLVMIGGAQIGGAFAQQSTTRGSATTRNDTSVSKQGGQVNLQQGTQVAARLENTLDVQHAKVGDQVTMKTTQAIKQNGQTVVPKGSHLIGHVTDVAKESKSNGGSRIGIAFDQLREGTTTIPITGTITSVTPVQNSAAAASDDLFSSGSGAQSASSTRTSSGANASGNGGLLGGAGNTAGGVVNTATSTVGNTAGNTTSAVGSTVGSTTGTLRNTTNAVGGSLRGLQITQSNGASAQGGSTLSLGNGDLKLDSGTTFNLLISNSTGAGKQ